MTEGSETRAADLAKMIGALGNEMNQFVNHAMADSLTSETIENAVSALDGYVTELRGMFPGKGRNGMPDVDGLFPYGMDKEAYLAGPEGDFDPGDVDGRDLKWAVHGMTQTFTSLAVEAMAGRLGDAGTVDHLTSEFRKVALGLRGLGRPSASRPVP